jgi:hypothetical protein
MMVILKRLDDLGYPGYGISTNGTVWSLLNTHGRITDQWSQRETYLKRDVRYVKLQVGGKTREVRVAKLVMEAAFGPLPKIWGCKIRYESGDSTDCRLVNLKFGPLEDHFLTAHGNRFAKSPPSGFAEVEV